MLVPTISLLQTAREGGYAVGAFNVYNLEGARAVVAAAEAERSPAIVQVHPRVLSAGGQALAALCLAAARAASVPVAVHLDHSRSADDIRTALAAGFTSVMADGSHLPYPDNVAFSREMAALAHAQERGIEAELGKLTGTEDELTVPEYEARLTDPEQAADFVLQTGVDALAVCIGNVHGHYPGEPRLDFDRLSALQGNVPVPLVLHGASGLPDRLVRRAVELGVCKINVNTQVREAYLGTLKDQLYPKGFPDLLTLMADAVSAMQAVVQEKIRLFGSSARAHP